MHQLEGSYREVVTSFGNQEEMPVSRVDYVGDSGLVEFE